MIEGPGKPPKDIREIMKDPTKEPIGSGYAEKVSKLRHDVEAILGGREELDIVNNEGKLLYHFSTEKDEDGNSILACLLADEEKGSIALLPNGSLVRFDPFTGEVGVHGRQNTQLVPPQVLEKILEDIWKYKPETQQPGEIPENALTKKAPGEPSEVEE
jgi:hypothetical protein